jgi:hypothetical protein
VRTLFLNPLLPVCTVVYSVAMEGASFAAHRIVENFGPIGGLATIAAMYAAACWYERQAAIRIFREHEVTPGRSLRIFRFTANRTKASAKRTILLNLRKSD